jgi:hypothetical protein
MMPSGTYVIVGTWCGFVDDCQLDITVVPSSDPKSISEGLCGNSNGDPSDDFILRNSQTADYTDEPVLLAGSYM